MEPQVSTVCVVKPDLVVASVIVLDIARAQRQTKAAPPGSTGEIIQFNKYQEELRLSKEGRNELDIAKNLNMGKGEVELIIGLRR